MSCFVVCDAHIDVLVNAAAQYDLLGGQHPADLGADLLRENQASYAYRYEDRLDEEDREALTHVYQLETTEAPLHPAAVVRAAECYRYQSCEHPAWEGSAARKLVEALVAEAEKRMPAEDLAPAQLYGLPCPRYQASAAYNRMPWEFENVLDAAEHRWAEAPS